MRYKLFKIRLEPNNRQTTLFSQHCGVARHAYNVGLSYCNDLFKNGEKTPSAITLHKWLVSDIKKEYPWYYESSKCSPQEALRDLEKAFKNFHRLQKKSGYTLKDKKGFLKGLPNFKTKKITNKSSFMKKEKKVTQYNFILNDFFNQSPNKDFMATITLTKKQLNLISNALELYSRIGIIQFDAILNHPSMDNLIKKRFTPNKELKVGDRTLRGEIIEIGDDYIKTKGHWSNNKEEIKTWTDVDNIKLSPDWNSVHNTKDDIRSTLNIIKHQITGENFGDMGSLGIHNLDVDDSCRTAFDMYQVIRNAFYLENKKQDNDNYYSNASHVNKTSTVDNDDLIKIKL